MHHALKFVKFGMQVLIKVMSHYYVVIPPQSSEMLQEITDPFFPCLQRIRSLLMWEMQTAEQPRNTMHLAKNQNSKVMHMHLSCIKFQVKRHSYS